MMDTVDVVAVVGGSIKHFRFRAQVVRTVQMHEGGPTVINLEECLYKGKPLTSATFRQAEVVLTYQAENDRPQGEPAPYCRYNAA